MESEKYTIITYLFQLKLFSKSKEIHKYDTFKSSPKGFLSIINYHLNLLNTKFSLINYLQNNYYYIFINYYLHKIIIYYFYKEKIKKKKIYF